MQSMYTLQYTLTNILYTLTLYCVYLNKFTHILTKKQECEDEEHKYKKST